jgi:SAM-dependent methyltransferase
MLRLDATNLSSLEDGAFDAALALGPFYHLTSVADRVKAARELGRVVRAGGLAFVSFLPRLSGLAGLLVRAAADPEQVPPSVLERAVREGVFANPTRRGFQQGYFAEPDEIVQLFGPAGFVAVELVSLRGLGAEREAALFELRERAPGSARAFGVLHEATAHDPAVVRLCGHALWVLRRLAREEPSG